jgi:dolichyl-diphosphooligosaccharide--protein glycosyltransferase
MVPVIYTLVKKLSDWKSGIIASIFIAAVSGQYFSRSLYGYLDHHMLEVFFGTLFCMCFILTLIYLKPINTSLKKKPDETYPSWIVRERVAFAYCIMTGVVFLIGLFVMPTMVLFALIVGIYTVIQLLINYLKRDDSWYLVFINTIVFIIPMVGIFSVGFDKIIGFGGSNTFNGFTLAAYTLAQPIAYLLLIVTTVFFYYISVYRFNKETIKYTYYLIVSAIVGIIALFLIVPAIPNFFIYGAFDFFGQTAYASTVQEARSWTMSDASGVFGLGLLLMIFGFLTLLYTIAKDKRDEHIFAFIWFLLVIVSTIQHVRYEYYAAISVVVLSALFVGVVVSWAYNVFVNQKKSVVEVESSKKKPDKRKAHKKQYDPMDGAEKYISVAILVMVVALSGLFVYTSALTNYTVSANGYIRMNGDWKDAMVWLNTNTPDPGLDYYKIYDQSTFKYPESAYGVMSWWDYGHLITYIGKRIPNANPFQAGVAGPNGSAAYFMNTDEEISNKIADNIDIKYVVTDVEMDTGKFWAMSTWFNESVAGMPYQPVYLVEQTPGNPQPAQLLSDKYYLTMISKLHNFDGSMKRADSVGYVEYSDPSVNGNPYPSVMRGTFGNYTILSNNVAQYNTNPNRVDGYHATLIGTDPLQPVVNVPALQHYRLVYESPTDVGGGLHYVKIFEYVNGKTISGEGIIEVGVTTNTGRTFTYRQDSVNGTFTLPYATVGTPYQTKPTGSYHIVDANNMISNTSIDVTEAELH